MNMGKVLFEKASVTIRSHTWAILESNGWFTRGMLRGLSTFDIPMQIRRITSDEAYLVVTIDPSFDVLRGIVVEPVDAALRSGTKWFLNSPDRCIIEPATAMPPVPPV